MSADNYEVLRVRFIKARNYSSALAEFCEGKVENTTLMCLGHFDFIEIKSDRAESNPLQKIEQDQSEKNDIASIVYPHYLIKKCEKLNSPDPFWKNATHFTSIIRIHCKKPEPPYALIELLSKWLEKQLESELGKSESSEFQIDAGIKQIQFSTASEKFVVDYRIYDSLELGDAVAVLRSESLNAILHTIMKIRELDCVRSTYSYHGVAACALQDTGRLSNTKVFAATRFSLNEAAEGTSADIEPLNNAIKSILGEVGKPDCLNYITGATDYILNWGSISEKQLFGVVFQRMATAQSGLHEVLHESITRIGSTIDLLPAQKAVKQSTSLDGTREHLALIERLFKDPKRAIQDPYSQIWLVSLFRLIDSLETMSRSPYTDELCLLLAPGVEALLKQIEYRLKQDQKWNPALDKKINSFISSCVSLSNEIASIDSHLHQRPELTPVYYYVPAMLLRFVQEFTRRCCKAFKDCRGGTTEKCPTFIPLVKTSQQNYVATVCPIETVSGDVNIECPIQIDIPVNALFQPWRAALILGHEAAHYSGINTRQRDLRFDCLAACVANYICHEWLFDIDIATSKEALEELLSNSTIANLLRAAVENYREIILKSTIKDKHLRNVTETLSTIAWQIYSSQENFEKFFDNFIVFDRPPERLRRIAYFDKQPKAENTAIHRHIAKILYYYCNECYADIAVIILMNCSFSEYYEGIFRQEIDWISTALSDLPDLDFEKISKKWDPLKKYCDRIAFVTNAMSSIKMDNWNKNAILEELKRAQSPNINRCERWINETVAEQISNDKDWGNPNYALYKEEVHLLQDYFNSCAQMLNDNLNFQLGETDILRRALKAISDKAFDLKTIQQFVTGEN